MAWFKWRQDVGGEESWSVFLADQEERIVRERKPAFTTILAADNDCSAERMDAEDWAKIHYKGPYYVDFDADSLGEAINKVQQFIRKLRDDHNFDCEQAQYYASGGKGFHVIIPEACFLEKPSSRGFAFLPAIYKEISMELYVDTLDLRVYTARRGRQFRTANVERPDKPGVHKVPLSYAEIMEITEDTYRELVKAPRHVPPPLEPTYNIGLGLLFVQAKEKVERAQKNRKKSKVDEKLLKKFGGDFPPSIVALMTGENVAHDVGFQKIALQLALAAHALGKSEQVFLALCDGLCERHVSDGTRYNTPAKRRRELSRMWAYCDGNPCYTFSVGGIKSTMTKDTKTPDLDSGGIEIEEEEAADGEALDGALTQGMRITTKGIFRMTAEGLMQLSSVGLSNPKQLLDTQTGDTIGYEVDLYVDGDKRGRRVLTMDTFQSRAKFMNFTLSAAGSNITASDPQVGAMADILRGRAARAGHQAYTASREGLDLVVLPGGEIDIIWADTQGVVSTLDRSYRLIGKMAQDPEYRTDLRMAPELMASPLTEEFFTRLFQINNKEALGRMLGWYTVAFFTQPIRFLKGQFPYLQVFGPAGAGKTKTNELLAWMHYWRIKPRRMMSSHITKWSLESLVSASASIPLLLDEFKPREMSKIDLDRIKSMLRGNYDAANISKGHLNRETGSNRVESRQITNTAPIVVIGEALESQTAILDRAIIVSLDKAGKRGHHLDFNFCETHREVLSSFGNECRKAAMLANLDKIRATLTDRYAEVAGAVPDRADDSDRPIFNIAVDLAGLDLFKSILGATFGTQFDQTFMDFREAILGAKEAIIPRVISEASKVLNVMSHLSHLNQHEERMALVFGVDYVTNPKAGTVELHLRNAFTKYQRFQRALGEESLYDNYEAFHAGMQRYAAVVDKVCIDSPVKTAMSMHVFAFDSEILEKEGVGIFDSK